MDSSPLGRLPAEIRNRIYEYAFYRTLPIKIEPGRSSRRRLMTDINTYRQRPKSLLRTCRQINQESSQLFYSMQLFHIETLARDLLEHMPLEFFTMIGERNRLSLQHVSVMHPSMITAKAKTEFRRWEVLCWMVDLRRMARNFSLRSLTVCFRCNVAKEAFWLQGLAPQLQCDLYDLGEPWEVQIEALIMQRNIWKQTAHQLNGYRWLASDSLKIADIMRSWKHVLAGA